MKNQEIKTVKRFVIAKSMIGKNLVLEFKNKKEIIVQYNHDKVYEQLKDRFEAMPCFAKYKSYTNTNDLPVFVRELKEII
jgi:hypothetical protein